MIKDIYKDMMEQAEPSAALIQKTKSRMGVNITEPHPAKTQLLRLAPVAACFVILLLAVTAIPNLWNSSPLPPSDFIVASPTQDASSTPGEQQGTLPPVTPSQIPENTSNPNTATTDEPPRIIEITGLVEGQHSEKVILSDGELNFISDISLNNAAPPFINPQTTYQEKWSLDTIVEYLGMDFRPDYIPDDLLSLHENAKKYYDSFGIEHNNNEEPFWTVVFNDDGTRVPFSFTFGLMYSENFNDEYNSLKRTLDVKAAKDEYPYQCALYATEIETISNIKGIEIIVGYCKMGYGYPGKKSETEPMGYYDIYVAEFMYEGIGYYIKSENLTQEEFVNVLLSVVK